MVTEARDLHFFHLTYETLTCLLHLNILFYTIFHFFNRQYSVLISKRSCSFTVQRISYKFRTVERPLDTSVCLY